MIFFDNCGSFNRSRQSLSFARQLGRFFRPPTLLRILFIYIFLCLSSIAHAVQVTLNLKSVPLETAFTEIKKQSGYGFWYDKKDIADLSRVTIDVKDADLATVLEVCLKGQPLTYQVFDKTIVVKRKAAAPVTPPAKKALQEKVKGKVVDAQTKEPLAGVLVKVKSPVISVVTDDKGEFELNLQIGKYDLTVQYLGYSISEISITIPVNGEFVISLDASESTLSEVQVVNTGYQSLPQERATGSFTFIDEKTISRSVSPDLLSRLNGVSNGLLFDNTVGNSTGISVRGRSTIFSNTTPLIVIDNFPFEGDLNTINPDVIESVTLLKDAAAASIWGVRAGNGVIVITTKKGLFNKEPAVVVNGNLTIGGQPDLMYQPQLSSSQYIDVEKFLFDKGAYTSVINNGFGVISPVVAILQKIKLDPSYTTQGSAEIEELRKKDIRSQQKEYFYRNSNLQHYSAEVSGGSKSQTYYLSAGFDENLANLVSQQNNRITLKGSNSLVFLKDRLKVDTDISFSRSRTSNTLSGGYTPFLPYEQVANEEGNPLSTLRSGGLRSSYIEAAGNGLLLDWNYRPLEELRNEGSSQLNYLTDYRINLGLNYKIYDGLSLAGSYQFYNANVKVENLHERQSFYVRNMVNTFSSVNLATGTVNRPVPLGGIYNPIFSQRKSNYGRLQINYSKLISQKHQLTAILGYEVRDDNTERNSYTTYGYDPETGQSTIINPIELYPLFYNPASAQRIAAPINQGGTTDRYISLYGNASYSFMNKYVISGSYRKDESNLFGVKANQKGVPLWSTGLAWNIHNENFFKLDWISSLQLKGTFGYSGNVNNSISAYLTASSSIFNPYSVLGFAIVNPPNDNLRWERIKNINFGVHFGLLNNRVTGSVEYYKKNGLDLIGTSPIAPQTGVSLFTGNTANSKAVGIDVQLNTKNLDGVFKWNSIFIFNHVKDVITDYKVIAGNNSTVVNASTNNLSPIVGYPINSVFAFRWAGLDGAGNPRGYLNGNVTADYTSIRNSNNRDELDFFGSASPNIFGSIRNTFSFRNLELSFNVIYKLDYFFKRSSLNNSSLYSGVYRQRDYDKRWQNPGDELHTDVPNLVYPSVTVRNEFYSNSAVLIERGDHIRLQDIQINYTLSKKMMSKLPFRNINVYAYANNIGLLWKKNHQDIDPDFRIGFPNPRSIAFGIRTNF